MIESIPQYIEEDSSTVEFEYYDCPQCDDPICEWCDCPNCGWYDVEGWEKAIAQKEE